MSDNIVDLTDSTFHHSEKNAMNDKTISVPSIESKLLEPMSLKRKFEKIRSELMAATPSIANNNSKPISSNDGKVKTISTLTASNNCISSQTINPSSTSGAINTGIVWLVVHLKEPYYHSAWSYDHHLRYGPTSIDKMIVGVYTNFEAAKTACTAYWKTLRLQHGEDGYRGNVEDFEEGYFYDAMSLIGDVNVINQRVFLEKREMNRPPKLRDVDKKLLARKGKI